MRPSSREPTACYEATTRSEKLAEDVIDLACRHGEDLTIVTVSMEPIGPEHGQSQWAGALALAATRGAQIEIYLGAWATGHETCVANAIARRQPNRIRVRELNRSETLATGPLTTRGHLLRLEHGPRRISHDHALLDWLTEERKGTKHNGIGKSPRQLARRPQREHDRARGSRRESMLEEPVRHPAHVGWQGDLRIGWPHPGTHQIDQAGESRRVDGHEHDAIMAVRASTEQPPCAAGSRRT